jgi:hypothetical protein
MCCRWPSSSWPRSASADRSLLSPCLHSDDFPARSRASRDLAAVAWQAEPALRRALAADSSTELRNRLTAVLKLTEEWRATDPQTLRTARAIWALQRMGTPEARALLEQLAGGAPGARQTEEARAALAFLQRRRP